MIITSSDDISDGVQGVLQSIADTSTGMTIPEVLHTISQTLRTHDASGSHDAPYTVDSDIELPNAESDFEAQSDLDDYGSEFGGGGGDSITQTFNVGPEQSWRANKRIREDLRAARFAGFKIGVLCGMKADSVTCLASLSIQVRSLGLSEEAKQAWDLDSNQYIVLLVRYLRGYQIFERIVDGSAQLNNIDFRVGVSNRYKPTVGEALAAFTDLSNKPFKAQEEVSAQERNATAGFQSMFISSSLNEFINSHFIPLLKVRHAFGFGWDGAKLYYNDHQGRLSSEVEGLSAEYSTESIPSQGSVPHVTTADHLTDHESGKPSFPLIAAQFLLRYLTRCTEFCLVCHDRIKEDFGALKPYVCEKPLCLYQYMSLGFGPSIEHEILTQPYVVDLLVSFCYASAMVCASTLGC